MSSGMNFGVRASVPHLLGICFGVPVLMAAIGFGAGTLFQLVPWSHTAIKILGLSYLFYLAYRIATSAPDSLEGGRSRPFTFFEAALFQWINPKAWMMGISAIGTYTSVGMAMAPQVASVPKAETESGLGSVSVTLALSVQVSASVMVTE